MRGTRCSPTLSQCAFRSSMSDHSSCLVLIYQREPRKEIDDIVYEVDCATITVKAGADVDIGTVDSQAAIQD